MLGVTIAIGNSYKRMAERAAASFAKNAGLETRILTPRLPAHRLSKLHLFELVAEDRFIFFDADTLMIQEADLGFGFIDEGFTAVRVYADSPATDTWPPLWYEAGRRRIKTKCHRHQIDGASYFNSGLMWLNHKQHLEMFERAKVLPNMGPGDDDELHLNIAAKELGVKINVLDDDRCNRILTGEDDVPDDTVIVHAVACRDPMAGRQWMMDLEF